MDLAPVIEWSPTTNWRSPSWVDISAYCQRFSIRRGRQREMGRVEAGTATIELRDTGRNFDPDYATSPYHGNLLPMKALRIRGPLSGGTNPPLFYGVTESFTETIIPPSLSAATVEAADLFKILALKHITCGVGVGVPGVLYVYQMTDTPADRGLEIIVEGLGTDGLYAYEHIHLHASDTRNWVAGIVPFSRVHRMGALAAVGVWTYVGYWDDPSMVNLLSIPTGSSLQSAVWTASYGSWLRANALLLDIGFLPADIDVPEYAAATLEGGAFTGSVTDPTALDYMERVRASEAGRFYAAADGRLTFLDRDTLTRTPRDASIATFGDRGGSDIPYLAIKSRLDDQEIRNAYSLTSTAGAGAANDQSSQDAYGYRLYSESGLLHATEAEAQELADYYLPLYLAPQNRIDSLQVRLGKTSPDAHWASMLALDLSDRVTVIRAFLGGRTPTMNIWAGVSGTGWSVDVSGTILTHINGYIAWAYRSIGLVAGETYTVTYSITSYTSGSVAARLGDTAADLTSRSALGTYTETGVASGNAYLIFNPSGDFVGTIGAILISPCHEEVIIEGIALDANVNDYTWTLSFSPAQ